MISFRSDSFFLILLVVILLLALVVTSRDVPGPPPNTAPLVRAMPTETPTAPSGWWDEVALATPGLPALAGLPYLTLSSGRSGDASGPVAFDLISCPGPEAVIRNITRRGVWWDVDGTANVEDFSYWKMELSADGSNWTVLYRSESPVANGRLMEFNTSTVPPGRYRLRLVVVKKDGNYPGPCEIAVG